MHIKIWSDIVCPFCYIGKRHLEQALEQLPDIEASITWKSFELDPNAPKNPEAQINMNEYLAEKYGKSIEWAEQMNTNVINMAKKAGLDYNLDEVKRASSFDAHRLIHWANEQGKQAEMKEKLLSAYFIESKHIADKNTLAELAEEIGLDKTEALKVLNSNQFAQQVIDDVEQAHKVGVQGVPFFVINDKYALSGAQPTEVFVETLQKISQEENS